MKNTSERIMKKFKIEKLDWITRDIVQANPEKIFLFGDNLQQVGLGGQAGAMRGEPNAIGVPTKKTPSMNAEAFFSDEDLQANCDAIDLALLPLQKLSTETTIVIPSAGLGTGLADLENKAPKTFAYLEQELASLGLESN